MKSQSNTMGPGQDQDAVKIEKGVQKIDNEEEKKKEKEKIGKNKGKQDDIVEEIEGDIEEKEGAE